jgi:hypothetical protein
MPESENKTKPTAASVDEYIASRADDQQRSHCQSLTSPEPRSLAEKSPL